MCKNDMTNYHTSLIDAMGCSEKDLDDADFGRLFNRILTSCLPSGRHLSSGPGFGNISFKIISLHLLVSIFLFSNLCNISSRFFLVTILNQSYQSCLVLSLWVSLKRSGSLALTATSTDDEDDVDQKPQETIKGQQSGKLRSHIFQTYPAYFEYKKDDVENASVCVQVQYGQKMKFWQRFA